MTIYTDETALGEVLACKRKFTAQKINAVALDGTPYVQTPGEAIQRREVHVYCDTYKKRDLMDTASNTGALLTWEWNNETIIGYIETDPTWKEWKDGHGVCELTVIVREVV